MDRESTNQVGRTIRAIRADRGISQEALARLAEVSVNTVARIERGMSPRLSTMERIAKALDVSVSAFFEDAA